MRDRIQIAVTGLRGIPAIWGGIEHHCENLYPRLVEKGYSITVYSRNYYTPPEVTCHKGLRVKRLPTIQRKYSDAALHTFLSLCDIIRNRPDIVHIHGSGPAFFSWIPGLFQPSIKVIFTCHGLDWQRKKWPRWASGLIYLGELSAIRFAAKCIVVSREIQDYFQRVHGLATSYIPNGISPFPYRPPKEIRRWGLSEIPYYLCVTRLVPEKRVEDIIEAFLSRPREPRLVITGDHSGSQDYAQYLRNQYRSHRSIIFTGYQYGAVLEELYSNARAFITASELEGLPITLLEALSAGVPCIASDIGPHREILTGLSEMTFSVGDLHLLSRHMESVDKMTDAEHQEFREKAKAKIRRDFNWESAALSHHILYQSCLLKST